jgi:Ulp1 family protease
LEGVIKDLVEGDNLNWEAADRYLRLVSASLGPDSKYRIMTSSFIKALNSRENNKLKKFLSDGGIKSTHVIIIPILASGRWYFAKIENEVITLYDCNEEISEKYRSVPPIKEILRIVKDEDKEIKVGSEFPQTKVSRDSGIFMLLGIRDVVEEKTWTFTEDEVKQKRSQIIQELLEGQLIKGEI